jgi:hypothetical protein
MTRTRIAQGAGFDYDVHAQKLPPSFEHARKYARARSRWALHEKSLTQVGAFSIQELCIP